MKTETLFLTLSATALATTLVAGVARADDERDREIVIEKEIRRVINGEDCPNVEVHGLSDSFVMSSSKKGFLGVEITSLTPELRGHFGLPESEGGVMIGKIVESSAAERAGLQVGDILSRVDGATIEGSWQLTSAVRRKGGETVDLEYWRDGSVYQASALLDEKQSCAFDLSGYVEKIEDIGARIPELHLRGLQISEDSLEEVMESLRAVDWEQHLKRIEEIDLEGLEERMEGLSERFEELGERLELEGLDLEDFEHVHRDRLKVLEDGRVHRLEAQARVRQQLALAKEEARRARAEGRRHRVEARQHIHEQAAHARAVMREAEARAEQASNHAAEARALAVHSEEEARGELEESEEEEGGGGPI